MIIANVDVVGNPDKSSFGEVEHKDILECI